MYILSTETNGQICSYTNPMPVLLNIYMYITYSYLQADLWANPGIKAAV